MRPLLDHLEDLPFPTILHSTSSLDIYFDQPESSTLFVFTEGDLIELAKVFTNLEYPGTDVADAILLSEEGSVFFKTVDSVSQPPILAVAPANLFYVPRRRKYIDPYGVYQTVRNRQLIFADEGETAIHEIDIIIRDWRICTDTAILLSRYEFTVDSVSDALFAATEEADDSIAPRNDETDDQRRLLIQLFESRNPAAGLRFLRRVGYINAHWPELSAMYGVAHTKEHHPEGNVWEHTLETFLYRKDRDLALSLGLLFHDSGKPYAQRNEGRMFDRHSLISSQIAAKLMRRIGFGENLVQKVGFLVREHMLPGLLPKLPTYRIERTLSSDLFPLLLELYRCDLSSTYRGPDGYYKACKVYRSYLKNVQNPFRTSDGRKILRRYVAN